MQAEELEHIVNPFTIFPSEIWEIILDHIDDTAEVVQILHAFPHLSGLSQGRQFSWLFGKILPLILPKFLNLSDIKSCRLVSKRWMNAVSTSLEIHPDRLPYNSARLNTLTGHNFNYHTMPSITPEIRQLITSCSEDSPADNSRNPFPGRYIRIDLGVPQAEGQASINLWDIIPTLEKVGHHIYFLHIVLWGQDDCEEEPFIVEFVHVLFQCLVHTPNLRSFTLDGYIPRGLRRSQSSNCLTSSIFPCTLPKLETLMLTDFPEISKSIHDLLLTSLTSRSQIKKLGICYPFWEGHYGSQFPNLVELHLSTGKSDPFQATVDVFSVLDSPFLLRKLRIKSNTLNIYGLLNALETYQIESLELVGFGIQDDNYSHKTTTVPSIIDLKIRVYPFEFLKSLPSLRYISIHCDGEGWNRYDPAADRESSFGAYLRDFLYDEKGNRKKLNMVWRNLPVLDIVSIYDDECRQYVREYPQKVFKAYNMQSHNMFIN